MRARNLCVAVALAALFSAPTLAAPIVIEFDDVAPGVIPGNHYEDECVLFSSGRVSDAITIEPGAIVTLTDISNDLTVESFPSGAISDPNQAIATGGGTKDLLMEFTEPVGFVSITTDEFLETPELVRLIALEATGNPNEYKVLQFVEGLDNATTSPANLLELTSTTPFTHVIFQTSTTESEAFDNLTFIKGPVVQGEIPEPSTLALVAIALGGCWAVRRRSAA
ncbi:MAG: PEP-CTERM sorting domain-containing protein [Aeoliella sp.]